MRKIWKGTWLHKLPSTPEEVRGVARRLADANFDMLIPCVLQTSGIADFQSKVANLREEFRTWDPLEVLVEEAQNVGLEIHAWCCVFPEGKDSALLAKHPEFAAQPTPEKERGESEFRLACPNRPEVQDYEASIYQELLDNYPIAGVSLDYIRYTDGLCFCEYCQEDYRNTTGGDLTQLGVFHWNPQSMQDTDTWITWRCEAINRFVRRMRAATQDAQKELSASVFHYYPGGLLDIGQDWELWVREGWVDHIWPMNYSHSTQVAAKWTRNNVASLAGKPDTCQLREGILRPVAWDTPRFIQHVEDILAAGVDGITIFEYPYLTDTDLEALKNL